MSSLSVEWWSVEKPQPYDRNARIIPQSAIDVVAKSLEAYGWRQPLVVDKNGVLVVGHTRLLAAKQLKLKEVPVHVAGALSEDQIKAYRLMDNRSNQESMWDHLILKDELSRLSTSDTFDVALTGFSDQEFAAFAQEVDVGRFTEAPKGFKTFGEELETDCFCPHCNYKWKGGQSAGDPEEEVGKKGLKYTRNASPAVPRAAEPVAGDDDE